LQRGAASACQRASQGKVESVEYVHPDE
jgi:hypothetical protein